jgi:16S rRNA (guanine527-N7)-methyltransferase
MDLIEFWTICASNGIVLGATERERIERYARELKYWNAEVNLISRKDEDNILERHILHSLSALKYIQIPNKSRCIDIGTGGGLPGIPLAIYNPTIYMTLVDSIAKKVKITSMMAKHTGIRHLKAENIRVEELRSNKENHEQYDFVFARAVTKALNIVNWSRELLKQDGKIVLYKGGNLEEEKNEILKFHHKLKIEEIQLDIFGAPWFKEEEKKLLIISK